MLPLDDSRWGEMLGGYRVPYDPRPALRRLHDGSTDTQLWDELWNELHHQGDVDIASYASVPHLVAAHVCDVPEWNTYALVGTIALRAGRDHNPPVPDWLEHAYSAALRSLAEHAVADLSRTEDPLVIRSALGIIALAKRLPVFATVLLEFDEDEVRELLVAQYGAA